MATIPSGQKILTSAPEVNTTYGGSASLQALNTWYTMEDISNTVRPYKVYTALLTQSGGSDLQYIYNVSLTIGVTYFINNNDGSGDFTNVGATTNEQGTYFVATGTTPNNWGTQNNVDLSYNLGAPVATVLENTIGNIWFSYSATGFYQIFSNSLFPESKTFSINDQTRCIDISSNSFYNLIITGVDPGQINITIFDDVLDNINDKLNNKLIEIRVYN